MTEPFDYGRYLASREWAVLKEQIRERSGGLCERCHNALYEETHHVTYARIGHEQIEDLQAVCRPCHQYVSGKTDVDPAVRELPPLPIPFHYPGWSDSSQQLRCPVCSFEYVHIKGLAHECSPETCKRDDYTHGWVRGKVLSVAFSCESGHHFTLEFGSHKGGTFMRVAPEFTTDAVG